MKYFIFILFLLLNFISNFCNGCLPSPVIDPGPTITISTDVFTTTTPSTTTTTTTTAAPCPPNSCLTNPSGPGVVVTGPTVDANCVYTVVATCSNPVFSIIFNMDTANAAVSPQTLTCVNGIYQYDIGSGNTNLIDIQCDCGPSPCTVFTLTIGPGAEVGTQTADANCMYTANAFCTNGIQMIYFNGDTTDLQMSPQTITCDSVDGFFMGNTVRGPEFLSSIDCQCAPNPCLNSFTTVGTDIIIADPVLNENDCTYQIEASCTDPANFIQINQATDNIRAPLNPMTFDCDQNTMKYFYGIFDIDTLGCGCGDNTCPIFAIGPGVELSTPVSDAFCAYTMEARCTNPAFSLTYNNDPSTTEPDNPQQLTCNRMIWRNPFFTNIDPAIGAQCGCRPDSCEAGLIVGTGAQVVSRTSDNNCLYTVQISCINPAENLFLSFLFSPQTEVSSPQILTCSNPMTAYNYAGPPSINVNRIECRCQTSPCPTPFATDGAVINGPTADNNCAYSIEATCPDPATPTLIINFATDNFRVTSPQTIQCDGTQYTYMSTPVDTLQCDAFCELFCGMFPAGNNVNAGTPVADAACTYSIEVTCIIGTIITIDLANGMTTTANTPQTFTCTTGPDWLYNGDAISDTRCN